MAEAENSQLYSCIKSGITVLLVVLSLNALINLCFYCFLLNTLNSKLNASDIFDFQQFMSQYYIAQANWLNFWLFCLTIILAVIGIISAIDYRSKKEEMENVIQNANVKIKTNESKMNEMDKFINDATITIDENVLKMKEYMKEADKFAKEAKESEKISEAYSWFSSGNKAYNDKNYDEAIENYAKAIDINNNFIEAYYSKGAAYLNLKQFENAISEYKKIIEINPNYIDAYYNLIESYIMTGTLDKALETLNLFMQKDSSPYIYQEDYDIWVEALKKSEDKDLAVLIIKFIDENWRKIDGVNHH